MYVHIVILFGLQILFIILFPIQPEIKTRLAIGIPVNDIYRDIPCGTQNETITKAKPNKEIVHERNQEKYESPK